MFIKRKKAIFFALFMVNLFSGQQNQENMNKYIPQVFPPKSSVMSIFRMDQIPVNLATGIPDISNNLLSVNIDENLTYNFRISYHPSQIRVEEIGSELGVGWTASDLGIITRTVNGLHDDKLMWGLLDNGILSSGFNGYIYPTSTEWLKKRVYESIYSNQYDILSDEYMFSFMGNSGKFVFTIENGVIVPKILGIEGKFKISYVRDSSFGYINSFTIVDEKGYQYVFDLSETDSNILENTSASQITLSQSMPIIPQPDSYKNNWHLTKIINPNGLEVLNALYEMYSFPNTTIKNHEYNYMSDNLARQHFQYAINTLNHGNFLTPMYKSDYITKNNNTYKLKKINTINKAVIDFEKVSINNSDFLNKIKLSNNSNKLISSYIFNITQPGTKHLLKSIVNEQDTNNKYVFEYNEGGLQDIESKEKDNWGYYNNNGFDQWLDVPQSMETPYGADKRTNPLVVTSGALKYEVTPTKGVREYLWESNTFSKVVNDSIDFFDIDENRIYTPITFTKDVFNNQPSDEIFYVDTPQNINVTFSALQYTNAQDIGAYNLQIIPVKTNMVFDSNIILPSPSNCTEDISGDSNGIIRSKKYLQINSGTSVQINFFTKGLFKISLINSEGNLQYHNVKYKIDVNKYKLTNNNKYLYGGGLRIRQINFWDKVSDMEFQNTPKQYFQYFYQDFSDPTKSSGVLNNFPVYHKQRSIPETDNIICTTNSGPIATGLEYLTTSYGNVSYITSNNNAIVSSINLNGSFVTYSNVKVKQSEGYIKNYFTTPLDYNDYDPLEYTYPFLSSKNTERKYGLIMKKEVYDENSNLRTIENYIYNIVEPDVYTGAKSYVPSSGGCFIQNSPYSKFLNTYENYTWVSGNHQYNLAEVCGLFGSCGGYDSVVDTKPINKKNIVPLLVQKNLTEYFSNGNYKSSTIFNYNSRFNMNKETFKKSDLSIQETTYSYAHEKGNQYLIDKNMIGIPLETKVVKKKDSLDTNGKILSQVETKYPTSQTEANSKTSGLPLPYELLSKDLQNTTMSKEVTYTKYDPSNGNLQEYRLKDLTPVAIIWGYSNTQPIAKIEGALYDNVKTLSEVVSAIMASNTDHTQGTAASEQALVDALDNFRKLPALLNAQITTYTYDPLIGVRSITPPSGIREMYIYDTANRLEKIVDMNGKLLKEFKYNYKQ